jgi:hypothetical protein
VQVMVHVMEKLDVRIPMHVIMTTLFSVIMDHVNYQVAQIQKLIIITLLRIVRALLSARIVVTVLEISMKMDSLTLQI